MRPSAGSTSAPGRAADAVLASIEPAAAMPPAPGAIIDAGTSPIAAFPPVPVGSGVGESGAIGTRTVFSLSMSSRSSRG
jgi:hypothetical protein